MKRRIGFVSNSSSSSFILDKRYITADQLEKIKEYIESGCDDNEGWSLSEDEDFVRGYTVMDNGYLYNWMRENVDMPLKALVSWEGE